MTRLAPGTLADQQSGFMAALLDEDAALPAAWGAREREGLAIYRNAYRARLVGVLEETYPRTARLVGPEAFAAAAAHHLITCPPSGWTIDDAGRGFPETAAALFAEDGDVAELAWIEWSMHRAFAAADAQVLDIAQFRRATAAFNEGDWQEMTLAFAPGLGLRQVAYDCPALWHLLEERGDLAAARAAPRLPGLSGCAVWREGLRPTFALIDLAELEALRRMVQGASYGEVCAELVAVLGEEAALQRAGSMLAQWLGNGWITGAAGSPAAVR